MARSLNNAAIAALAAAALVAGCADMPSEELQSTASLTAEPARPNQGTPSSNMLRLAGELEAKGSVATAIPLYERAAAEPQADISVHVRLGDAYAKIDRFAEAEAAYRTALAKQTDYGPALLGLGGVLVRSGQSEEGLATLARAAPIVNKATAYDRLGVAHIVLGQPREALASFEQAHSMAPGDVDIATNLALASALSGQHDKAVALAKRIGAVDKLQEYHRRNLILVLGIAGQTDDAKLIAADTLDSGTVAQLLKRGRDLRKIASPKARALALGTVTATTP